MNTDDDGPKLLIVGPSAFCIPALRSAIPAIVLSAFCILHSRLGGFVGALWEPCGGFGVPIAWLSTRFEVALMSH